LTLLSQCLTEIAMMTGIVIGTGIAVVAEGDEAGGILGMRERNGILHACLWGTFLTISESATWAIILGAVAEYAILQSGLIGGVGKAKDMHLSNLKTEEMQRTLSTNSKTTTSRVED